MSRDSDKSKEAVLCCHVIALRPAQGKHPHQMWLVTVQVDSVVAGRFPSPTLSLQLHSPIKAGINIGGRYTVRVLETQPGEYRFKDISPLKESCA